MESVISNCETGISVQLMDGEVRVSGLPDVDDGEGYVIQRSVLNTVVGLLKFTPEGDDIIADE